jgi:hypothetical protein
MVSIGLTLASLFISGGNSVQSMDTCDEEQKNMASLLLFVPPYKEGCVKARYLRFTRPLSVTKTAKECKIRVFHGGGYEEWRLLGCYAVWLL